MAGEGKPWGSTEVDLVVVVVVVAAAAAAAAVVVVVIVVVVVVAVVLVLEVVTSQQHARVSQGRICSEYGACCYTGIEVCRFAAQTFLSPPVTVVTQY